MPKVGRSLPPLPNSPRPGPWFQAPAHSPTEHDKLDALIEPGSRGRIRLQTLSIVITPAAALATADWVDAVVQSRRSAVSNLVESPGVNGHFAIAAVPVIRRGDVKFVLALAILQRWGATVLVADVEMPNADGDALMAAIAKTTATGVPIPAIGLTGHGRELDHERALPNGFQLHLRKPVDADALLTAISTLVV